jgi:hypothetical protein
MARACLQTPGARRRSRTDTGWFLHRSDRLAEQENCQVPRQPITLTRAPLPSDSGYSFGRRGGQCFRANRSAARRVASAKSSSASMMAGTAALAAGPRGESRRVNRHAGTVRCTEAGASTGSTCTSPRSSSGPSAWTECPLRRQLIYSRSWFERPMAGGSAEFRTRARLPVDQPASANSRSLPRSMRLRKTSSGSSGPRNPIARIPCKEPPRVIGTAAPAETPVRAKI